MQRREFGQAVPWYALALTWWKACSFIFGKCDYKGKEVGGGEGPWGVCHQ